MIAHLMLFKLRGGASRGDARVRRVVAEMAALPERIPLIRAWEHGWFIVADKTRMAPRAAVVRREDFAPARLIGGVGFIVYLTGDSNERNR